MDLRILRSLQRLKYDSWGSEKPCLFGHAEMGESMGKNRKYENVYQITVSGTTTNGFTAELRHKLIKGFVEALNYPGITQLTSFKVIKTEGDFNAITGETKED